MNEDRCPDILRAIQWSVFAVSWCIDARVVQAVVAGERRGQPMGSVQPGLLQKES